MRLLGHRRELAAIIAEIGDLVRNDQVMLRIDHRLHIVAEPARRADSLVRLCRLFGAGDGRFADGGELGRRGRSGANCTNHHRW